MATRADMEKSQEEEMRTPKQMRGVTYILQLVHADHWHPCNSYYFLNISLFLHGYENGDREA